MDPRYPCSAHCLVSFSADKADASVVNPAKSTLGDTDDGRLRTFREILLAQVCMKARASLGEQLTEQRLLVHTVHSRFSVGISPTAFVYDMKRHERTPPPFL